MPSTPEPAAFQQRPHKRVVIHTKIVLHQQYTAFRLRKRPSDVVARDRTELSTPKSTPSSQRESTTYDLQGSPMHTAAPPSEHPKGSAFKRRGQKSQRSPRSPFPSHSFVSMHSPLCLKSPSPNSLLLISTKVFLYLGTTQQPSPVPPCTWICFFSGEERAACAISALGQQLKKQVPRNSFIPEV